jgi:hypothetical protein
MTTITRDTKVDGVPASEYDRDAFKRLGLKLSKQFPFKAEDERQYAIKVLNVIAQLKQRERSRVLRRAITMNQA